MKYSVEKIIRVLFINDCLQNGQVIKLRTITDIFKISNRSAFRDIDVLRVYYADRICWGGEYQNIIFDRSSNGYRLVKQ